MATEKTTETVAEKSKAVTPDPELKTVTETPVIQADAPTPPHPSTDLPDKSRDTKEVAEARGRAEAANAASTENTPTNLGKLIGDPIQCIVKKRFYDERGATVREGATYWFQLREGQNFPYDVLEPVDKTLASKYRKAFEARAAEKRDRDVERARFADNFAAVVARGR